MDNNYKDICEVDVHRNFINPSSLLPSPLTSFQLVRKREEIIHYKTSKARKLHEISKNE
jgi:hypothetical protein